MKESVFDKDLKIVQQFGKEVINGKKFENYLSGEEEYFEIIETMMASMVPWKKNYKTNQILEMLTFYFRRIKSTQRKKEKHNKIKEKSIVFLPISPTNISLFNPIIKKLIEKNYPTAVLRFDYSLNELKKDLENKNIPYVNFEAYINNNSKKKLKKIYAKYKLSLKLSLQIVKRNKKYEKLKPILKYFFGTRKRFYEVLEFVEGFKNFLDEGKPSIVILPHETMDITRAASYICKKKSVPCVFFQDGNPSFEVQESKKTFATKKIVFGKLSKDISVKKGFPKNKISITGSPLYDKMFNEKVPEFKKIEIKKELGLDGKKVILFASTTNLKVDSVRLKAIFEIMRKNSNLGLIIKQHPGEYSSKKYENFYKKLAKKYSVKVVINKGEMWRSLNVSDIYVTEFSTTILEALILDKPIILTNFERFYKYDAYPEFEGVIWHTYNFEDVDNALKQILENKISKKTKLFKEKLIKNSLYKTDGKSVERVLKIIMKLKI